MKTNYLTFSIWVSFFLLCYSTNSFSQDERFYRDVFSGYLNLEAGELFKRDNIFSKSSPIYQIDITGDGRMEGIVYKKEEGRDYVHLFDSMNQLIFSYRFETKGVDANLFRIQMSQLNADSKIIIFHFYEGHSSYLDFHSSARVYFLTIDNAEFGSISMYRGPAIWHEGSALRKGTWRRRYNLELIDLTGDASKEVLVSYQRMNRVYKYLGDGEWLKI